MNDIIRVIEKNPFRDYCVPAFTKAKREVLQINPTDTLWNAKVRRITPPRLTTAWQFLENPMMVIGGSAYNATESRDHAFTLQQEAATNLRGNRKLSKVKVAEALAVLKPTMDQTKIVAGVLYALKRIQTVCFDEEKKEMWTVPEDLRAWSASLRTIWIDSKCENCLEWDTNPNMSSWVGDREKEGWKIEWPVSEGTMEEIKTKMADEFPHITVHAADGKKAKKEDYAKTLGRCEAVRHLFSLANTNVETLDD
jgi:hypothetical protein